MKKFRGPTDFASNASRLHKHVGALLIDEASPFRRYTIYQEYPVREVNSAFKSGREKYDWVILDLHVAIEVQGQQHYKPVCFGGEELHNAKNKFVKQIQRDQAKREAAEDVNWSFILIQYTERHITLSRLTERIHTSIREAQSREVVGVQKPKVAIPHPVKYNWPKGRKIPSRPFPKRKMEAK